MIVKGLFHLPVSVFIDKRVPTSRMIVRVRGIDNCAVFQTMPSRVSAIDLCMIDVFVSHNTSTIHLWVCPSLLKLMELN